MMGKKERERRRKKNEISNRLLCNCVHYVGSDVHFALIKPNSINNMPPKQAYIRESKECDIM